MNCAQWEERIADQIGGPFSEEAGDHLRACTACAALAAELASDCVALQSTQPGTESEYAGMRRRVRATIVRQRRVRRSIPLLVAAAAAVLVFASIHMREPGVAPASAPAVPRVAARDAAPIAPAVSPQVERRQVSSRHSVRRIEPPPVDLALLRKAAGIQLAPESGSDSRVEMQIATANPNVTIILLQPKEGSYE